MSEQENRPSAKRPPFRLMSSEGWIGGVCAGIAYYFAWPLWLVRIVLVLLLLATNLPCVLAYVLLWIFVPDEGSAEDFDQRTGGSS